MIQRTLASPAGGGAPRGLTGSSPEAATGAVPRTTLGDQVYDRVRDAIIHGEIPEGAEINQVELAGTLGVSRVPVREALRRLQAEHLLVANPYQRFVVTKLSREQVIELFDLRRELETFAALRARSRDGFMDAELPEARSVAARMHPGMSAEEWVRTDMEFHRALYGRSSAVAEIIDEVRLRVYRYVHLAAADPVGRERVLAEHEAILDALERGDEGLVRAVIGTHVAHARDRVTGMGGPEDGDRPADV